MTDENQPTPIQTFTANEGILNTNSTTINTVNIRSGPSLNRSVIHQGKEGDKVKILDQTKPAGVSNCYLISTRKWTYLPILSRYRVKRVIRIYSKAMVKGCLFY